MSLLQRPGIRRLSELEIDADKNWQAMGITNLREVAPGMMEGDLIVRDPNRLARLPAGLLGHVLTSAGPNQMPVWMPPPGVLETFIPVWVYMSKDEGIVVVDKETNHVLTGLVTTHVQTYEDDPGDMIKQLRPQPEVDHDEDIVTVDKTIDEDDEIHGEAALEYPVGGAVLDDDGVETDYTDDINDEDTATTKLLSDVDDLDVDDAFYFGFEEKWAQLRLQIHLAAVGNYMLAEEYYDGIGWSALTLRREGTGEFRISGVRFVKWDIPTDWEKTTIQGKELYWIRFRVATLIDYATQPFARQAWCEILA